MIDKHTILSSLYEELKPAIAHLTHKINIHLMDSAGFACISTNGIGKFCKKKYVTRTEITYIDGKLQIHYWAYKSYHRRTKILELNRPDLIERLIKIIRRWHISMRMK